MHIILLFKTLLAGSQGSVRLYFCFFVFVSCSLTNKIRAACTHVHMTYELFKILYIGIVTIACGRTEFQEIHVQVSHEVLDIITFKDSQAHMNVNVNHSINVPNYPIIEDN